MLIVTKKRSSMVQQDTNTQLPPLGQATPPPDAPPAQFGSQPMSASNEELIEAIIDEKWNELVKDVTTIIEWKNATETKIRLLEQKLQSLSSTFEDLHKAVLGKVGEYDKHILDVGAEIQSMEKVFAKVLPVFTQNVSELTRITDDLRTLKGSKED